MKKWWNDAIKQTVLDVLDKIFTGVNAQGEIGYIDVQDFVKNESGTGTTATVSQDFVTKELNNKADKSQIPDTSDFLTKSGLQQGTGNATNNTMSQDAITKNFATQDSLEQTNGRIDGQAGLISELQTDKADKSEIPDTSGLATKVALQDLETKTDGHIENTAVHVIDLGSNPGQTVLDNLENGIYTYLISSLSPVRSIRTYIIQRNFSAGSLNTKTQYEFGLTIRVRTWDTIPGTWSDWSEYRTADSLSYSTEEKNTGLKWVDGRDLYSRTFPVPATAKDEEKEISPGVNTDIVDVSGRFYLSDGNRYTFPYFRPSMNMSISMSENAITYEFNGGDETITGGYLTIYYTKTV